MAKIADPQAFAKDLYRMLKRCNVEVAAPEMPALREKWMKFMHVLEERQDRSIDARLNAKILAEMGRLAAGRNRSDWFETLGFCVPRAIREPWMGDLREDRQLMVHAGRGRLFVELATACQVLCLVAATLWDSAKETIARSFRMS